MFKYFISSFALISFIYLNVNYKFPNNEILFSGSNTVYLTIDDIPWNNKFLGMNTSIDKIYNTLAENNCSATLMIIGEYLENVYNSTIELLKKAHDENVFNFANHGYTNQKHANLSPEALGNEIKACEKIIETKLDLDAEL